MLFTPLGAGEKQISLKHTNREAHINCSSVSHAIPPAALTPQALDVELWVGVCGLMFACLYIADFLRTHTTMTELPNN